MVNWRRVITNLSSLCLSSAPPSQKYRSVSRHIFHQRFVPPNLLDLHTASGSAECALSCRPVDHNPSHPLPSAHSHPSFYRTSRQYYAPSLATAMKYVVVSGGVVSGLGKGVTASSIGVVLKSCGLRVTSIKIGTLRPSLYGVQIQKTVLLFT